MAAEGSSSHIGCSAGYRFVGAVMRSLAPAAGSRPTRVLVVGIVVLALLTAAGLLVTRTVKSPAQRAADTAPPPPTVLTAAVEKRVLTSTLIQRGTVVADRQVSVTPPASGQAQVQVLTDVRARSGEAVQAGTVVVAVSGRPLVVLPGRLPAYRDLGLGATGPDVSQLQKALAQVEGGTGGDPDGTFGRGTADALGRLYSTLGYPAAQVGGGNGLPLAEVAYLPSFPAVVTSVNGDVGDVVKAPLVGFASGELRVVVKADPTQAVLAAKGQRAQVVAEALGEQADAEVVAVGTVTTAPLPGQPPVDSAQAGAATPYVPVTVRTAKALPPAWLGQDVRVTVTAARTDGEVLVVPLSAVTTAADGTTRVTVVAPGGARRAVAVTAGASGDGYVAVEPAPGQTLVPGDQVVTGQ